MPGTVASILGISFCCLTADGVSVSVGEPARPDSKALAIQLRSR
jgi:hypothetical protein